MNDIKMISELVVKQQAEYLENPMYNEYMRLQFNVSVFKDKLAEIQDIMKFK
jgi:hypothetical protein